ncbi:hypothetical protein AXK58_21535 [Tsukamurella tyrosinosolvens]|nr:hypothetical protein AXK58_21535 [Tsukamurella tyrosinosolvens]
MHELGLEPRGPEARLSAHLAEQDTDLIARLVHLREAAGITRESLAQAWAVPVGVIEEFEAPGADPRLSMVRHYAAAIGARYSHRVELDADVHPSHIKESER